MNTPYAFRVATVGGTFNRLHPGHTRYIDVALRLARRVCVHVSSNEFAHNSKTYEPRNYQERVGRLEEHLAAIGALHRCQLRRLDSREQLEAFVLTTPELDLAVVEPQYYDFFLGLAKQRESSGLDPLYLLVKVRTMLEGQELSSGAVAVGR